MRGMPNIILLSFFSERVLSIKGWPVGRVATHIRDYSISLRQHGTER